MRSNMTRILWTVIASIVLLTTSSQCAKILVFVCQMAKSHHLTMHPIIKELAVRGHEVDYYTHHKIPNAPKTLRQFEFDVPNYDSMLGNAIDIFENVDKPMPLHKLVKSLRDMTLDDVLTPCYKSPQIKELLASNNTYDMVMGEFSVWQEEYAVLVHRFKALGVALQTFPDHVWLNELIRLPYNPSYMVPSISYYTPKMSFFEKLDNVWTVIAATVVEYYYVWGPFQRLADKELQYPGWESRPSLLELASDMALVLTSNHHSLSYAYPTAPHVKEVMGTNVEQNPPPLPEDLQQYMDSAEHGVIYLSFGTMVSLDFLNSRNLLTPLLETLSTLKQKVLFKWSSHSGAAPPTIPNIKFLKWLPQQSILAHPKIKLFMTHGGLGSLTEAVYHGVPLIASPVFADQPKNVNLLVNLGLGVKLSFNNFTKTTLKVALDEVLNNPKYKEEMAKRSAMFRDRPMKPVDEAVYWVEYVLRYGKVLQPASLHMPLYQFYLLDVVGFIAACTATIVFLSYRLLRQITRVLRNISQKKTGQHHSKKLD